MTPTIVSYLTARPSRDLLVAAHQQVTRDWWDERRRSFRLVASQLVLSEASAGDQAAAAKRLALLSDIELLEVTVSARDLAQQLLIKGAVPANAPEDALHVAVAAVHGARFLLTWNCKHIANAALRDKVEGACRAAGYEAPVLCTPLELAEEVSDAT